MSDKFSDDVQPSAANDRRTVFPIAAKRLFQANAEGMPIYPDGNPKTAQGEKKPGTAMIPSAALLHLGQVMRLGAAKYGPANWRVQGVSASVYFDAFDRHVRSWWDGEDIDPESGASHLAHAMACLAIMIDAKECGTLNDNRPPAGQASAMISRFATEGHF